MSEEATQNADAQDNTDAGRTSEDQGLLGSKPDDSVRSEAKPDEGSKEPQKEEETLLGKKKEEEASEPVKYEDFKLPEGYTLDGESKEEFEAFARESKLDQDGAQKAVDLMVKTQERIQERQNQEYIKDRLNWRDDLRKDPDFGGDKFDTTVNKATSVITRYGDEHVVDLLNSSGLGDHPSMVKMFARIARSMSEDSTPVGDGASTSKEKTAAEIMYPSQK